MRSRPARRGGRTAPEGRAPRGRGGGGVGPCPPGGPRGAGRRVCTASRQRGRLPGGGELRRTVAAPRRTGRVGARRAGGGDRAVSGGDRARAGAWRAGRRRSRPRGGGGGRGAHSS